MIHLFSLFSRRKSLKTSLVIASLLTLSITACSSSPSSDVSAKQVIDISAIAVTVTNTGCEPTQLSTAAGKTTFVINNKSDRPLEWEILEGVMVVAEKENIAPGFTQKVKADLKAGQYAMTCGLRNNPKGVLTVTASTATQ
jgi:iron uptake system component EfeO